MREKSRSLLAVHVLPGTARGVIMRTSSRPETPLNPAIKMPLMKLNGSNSTVPFWASGIFKAHREIQTRRIAMSGDGMALFSSTIIVDQGMGISLTLQVGEHEHYSRRSRATRTRFSYNLIYCN